MALSSSDRRTLKQAVHGLKPVVMVGKEGLSETLVHAVVEALDVHELIKVRFVERKEERKTLAGQMSDAVGAVVVGVIGHVAILYRPHREPEKQRFGISLT